MVNVHNSGKKWSENEYWFLKYAGIYYFHHTKIVIMSNILIYNTLKEYYILYVSCNFIINICYKKTELFWLLFRVAIKTLNGSHGTFKKTTYGLKGQIKKNILSALEQIYIIIL